MAKSKTYVVFVGRQPGIYETWDECKAEVENFPGARFKGFYSKEEAVMAYREDDASASMALCNISRHIKEGDEAPAPAAPAKPQAKPRVSKTGPRTYPPEVILDSIAVDAGCMGNPGIMEYRGVYVRTGQEIFKIGPYIDGTNNIGEFLAIVHGLALLKKKGSNMPIYSDSRTAQAWVRNRKCKTTLAPTPNNGKLLEIVARAEAWLAANTWTNPIIKWETKLWGEIPADFGRK